MVEKLDAKKQKILYEAFEEKGWLVGVVSYGGERDYQALDIKDCIDECIIWIILSPKIQGEDYSSDEDDDEDEDETEKKGETDFFRLRQELGLSRLFIQENINSIDFCVYSFSTREDMENGISLFGAGSDLGDYDRTKTFDIDIYNTQKMCFLAEKIVEIKKKLKIN